mgnify:FL=1
MFLTYISEYKERYGFHLYAYALMRNHFHLLMEVGDIPLSRIMQSLLFRYTRYFNRWHGVGDIENSPKSDILGQASFGIRTDPCIDFPV